MSVLVKGMEKPEHCGYCRFRYDGICHALQRTQYSMDECPLVGIDDVGMSDSISRQAAIAYSISGMTREIDGDKWIRVSEVRESIKTMPSAEPTLYGYRIEHLALIARVMQKENVTPEKAIECFKDVGRIVQMIMDEQKEAIKKAVEQWMT